MAELGTVYDLKGLEQQLRSLFGHYAYNELQADGKHYCTSFCKLVEHHACWKVPLPQLRVLERALCFFTQASDFFTVGCDDVLRTLSSLALSIFELLLFFDQKDFCQDPLRKITFTFQECCLSLARFQNVHLLQVERLLRAGGPWANQTLHAILSESSLPQTEAERCISSEPPVFLELRIRYLLSCQRFPEAQALAKCCAQHPTVGQHLFFFQVYLTVLYKAAQHEQLLKEVADFSGKDAVNFICSLESEENDDLLLGFSRVFISQQLHRGDMHFLCDLVCLWGRLHSRLKTSKEALLKECEQLILSATNVNAIFPFIRAIIEELSEDGVQFCMELCANALRSCPPCDVITKSLIYKTMASLVPNDLEICRACALLVFFLERSVDAYKMVYILYMHPDQEYHVDCCPIGNRVRFETLQTLKKDLYFDPEFWNLIALRTNCLKLINEKVLSAALEEIMDEKWIPSYCLKEAKSSSTKSKFSKKNGLNKEKTLKGDQQNHKDTDDKAPAKKVGRPRLNKHLPLKKGNQRSRQWKDTSSEHTRRSAFWQLDRIHCNRALEARENRRTTRLSEKIPAKRMIRTPKWLLEDSGSFEKNPAIVKRQYPTFPYLPLRRRRVVVKNNTKDNIKPEKMLKEMKRNDMRQEKEMPLDSQTASTAPQVVLELSLPDNELLGTFTEESRYRHRGLPQRLFYKPTLKVPSKTEPQKVNQQNEVILKAQDISSFILMLHSYGKRPKGKKTGTNSHTSSSKITCSSDQVDVSNKEQLNDKPAVEMKVTICSQSHQEPDTILSSSREKLDELCTVTRNVDTVIESKVTQVASLATAITETTVEIEDQMATQKNRHSPRLEKAQNTEHISNIVSNKETLENDKDQVDCKLPPISENDESKPQEANVTNGEVLLNGTPCQDDDMTLMENSQAQFNKSTVRESCSETKSVDAQTQMPSVTVETMGKSKIPQSQAEQKDPVNIDPEVSIIGKNDLESLPTISPPSDTALEDDGFDPMEPQPECEESNLEFCCFFCHKDVKGRHLVAHAMFHYRKDECMFCGVAFKNNLKAMMHMSNHLEKLKKLQNPSASNSPKQSKAKAKRKTTVKAKTESNEKKRRGREKKLLPTERKLRSGYKFKERMKQEECSAKELKSQDHVLKVNGHIGRRKKRKDIDRIENNLMTKTRLRHRGNENYRNNEIVSVKIEKEKPLIIPSEQNCKEKVTSETSKQTGINRNIGLPEKLCCPVDGCTWSSVKKHAAFLYHILENHYPETKSLELAFRMANNSCSICKRVLYSFEHFQHHVGRHRSVPRHPCPHKGCTARFKTTIEMRRHARKHSPLQAVCCLPGCPKLFICQWALILHEKDHFSKRSKTTQGIDEPKSNQTVVKQEKQADVIKKCVRSKEKVIPTLTDKTLKDISMVHNPAISKKDISAQSAATRLLQRLRKRKMTKNDLSQQVSHKMVSSVGKPNNKLRHSLQRRENKAKERLDNKVLPPRQAKSAQNSGSVKNITLGSESNQAKVSEVCKKLKGGKTITDESKTRSTGGTETMSQRGTHMPTTKMIERNTSRSKDQAKMSNMSKMTENITRKLKRAAPGDDNPVIEANANMDTSNTIRVQNKKGFKNSSLEETMQIQNNSEEVICQNEICDMSNPTIDSKFVDEIFQEVTMQNEKKLEDLAIVDTAMSTISTTKEAVVTEVNVAAENDTLAEDKPVTVKDNMAFKAEEHEHEPTVEQENSKMKATDSTENASLNLTAFANITAADQVTCENGPEKDSKMLSSTNALSNAPVITAVEQNVASPQKVMREKTVAIDYVFEPPDNAVHNCDSVHKADIVENSVEMAARPVLADNLKYDGLKNTLKMANEGDLVEEDISILEKFDSTDLTANDNTSQTETAEPQKSDNITTEESVVLDITDKNNSAPVNTSNSLSETPEPAVSPDRFRPKFYNKNDILSALKTLVKSKNDKVKTTNEVKNSAIKRKNEVIKTSSKKLKLETQTQEDVAAEVDTSSASEEKEEAETPDCSTANVTSKEKESKLGKAQNKSKSTHSKDVKKQRNIQSKIKKEPKSASKSKVDKSTKKIKREKSETKSAKSKSKDHKIKAKTSSQVDAPPPNVSIGCSNEVNIQSMPAENHNQAIVKLPDHDGKEKEIQIDEDETKPQMPRESPVQKVKDPHNAASLKRTKVFELVPEEEENPLAAFEKALNEYKKRPYMRLPATAYLEEKFTVMPKRRKDMSMFFGPTRKIPATPQQRQRCANCFTTFSSEEELQWHLQQKCSSLFGFDSDEEGTS